VLWSVNLDGYGNPFSTVGTAQTNYGFTGELLDGGGLLDLRARRYNPALGVFTAQDFLKGIVERAMSLNSYSWVEGNIINLSDPTGYQTVPPEVYIEQKCGCFDTGTEWGKTIYRLCVDSLRYHQLVTEDFNYCDSTTPLQTGSSGYILSGDNLTSEQRRGMIDGYRVKLEGCLYNQHSGSLGGASVSSTSCNLSRLIGTGSPVSALTSSLVLLHELISYASLLSSTISTQQMMNDLTWSILGVEGPNTVLSAQLRGSQPPVSIGHASYPNTGFHIDFSRNQPTGQIRHFWAYLNTVAQGNLNEAINADIIHECIGIPGRQFGLDFWFGVRIGFPVGTLEDARLTSVAFRIGGQINEGSTDSRTLADLIRNTLGSNFTGDIAGHYYQDSSCKSILRLNEDQNLSKSLYRLC
jgi:RHS repeat-associated protein